MFITLERIIASPTKLRTLFIVRILIDNYIFFNVTMQFKPSSFILCLAVHFSMYVFQSKCGFTTFAQRASNPPTKKNLLRAVHCAHTRNEVKYNSGLPLCQSRAEEFRCQCNTLWLTTSVSVFFVMKVWCEVAIFAASIILPSRCRRFIETFSIYVKHE